ncbi:MAG: GNAT family N-acetyltransferase [Bacteroidetes bacterium]|nr:GNAT family N-acetyltransferase [Bacteroidota bacterium]
MEAIEVKDKATEKQFLNLPHALYSKDSNWVCPPHSDIRKIFDAEKNPAFQHGKAKRWIVQEQGRVLGRIAAFYQHKAEWREAGIGFFESVDDEEVADLLFVTATSWLKQQGFIEIVGPINFGQRDAYWGLLVEGFGAPAYQDNYHLPYYQRLFEDFGWEQDFEQKTAMIQADYFNHERLGPIAQKVTSKEGYSFRSFNSRNLIQMSRDFSSIYNCAWQGHDHFNPVQEPEILKMMKQMKPLVKDDLISLAYVDNEPAGFFVSIRDINPMLRKFRGRFGILQKLALLYQLKTQPVQRMRAIVFGVVPEHQNKGLETGMIWKVFEATRNYPHMKEMELSWIGDFNPRMLRLLEGIGAKPWKKHVTYRLKIKD